MTDDAKRTMVALPADVHALVQNEVQEWRRWYGIGEVKSPRTLFEALIRAERKRRQVGLVLRDLDARAVESVLQLVNAYKLLSSTRAQADGRMTVAVGTAALEPWGAHGSSNVGDTQHFLEDPKDVSDSPSPNDGSIVAMIAAKGDVG